MNTTLALCTLMVVSIALIMLVTKRVEGSTPAEAYAADAPVVNVKVQSATTPEPQNQHKYLLPQTGVVQGSSWQKVSHSMQLDPSKPYNIPWYDWPAKMKSQCRGYNAPVAPRSPQDCPDTSFTYVTDMSKFIPGAKGGGCIQLGIDSDAFCYSDDQGQYHPWWSKIQVSTP